MTATSSIPVACQLTDVALANRRQSVIETLVPHIQAREELDDGYGFCFLATNAIAQELLVFVLLERQCCPFFQMELVFVPGNEATWLRLRGGNAAKRFIETELAGMLA